METQVKTYNEPLTQLIEPYGGKLTNLLVAGEEREDILSRAAMLPRLQLTQRNLCDLEMLASGAFSPLTRFLGREDYRRVLAEMRLADGTLFPIPITLAVEPRPDIVLGAEISLVDQHNDLLAIMQVEEMYEWDLEEEAQLAYGTRDLRHPLVAELHTWGKLYISGELRVLALPQYHDFRRLRLTPLEVRTEVISAGSSKSGGLSDTQSNAPRSRRADQAFGATNRGRAPAASGGWYDQGRRYRSLHAGSILHSTGQ